MQTAWSWIWTQVVDFIFKDDKRYAKCIIIQCNPVKVALGYILIKWKHPVEMLIFTFSSNTTFGTDCKDATISTTK